MNLLKRGQGKTAVLAAVTTALLCYLCGTRYYRGQYVGHITLGSLHNLIQSKHSCSDRVDLARYWHRHFSSHITRDIYLIVKHILKFTDKRQNCKSLYEKISSRGERKAYSVKIDCFADFALVFS